MGVPDLRCHSSAQARCALASSVVVADLGAELASCCIGARRLGTSRRSPSSMEEGRAREELLRTRAALDEALAETKKRARAAQQRARAAERKKEGEWKVEGDLQRAALVLFDKAGQKPDAAAAFLARAAAKRKWPARPEVEVRRLVEDLFMSADLDEYTRLCDSAESPFPSALQTAIKFWEEWALAEWVDAANQNKGVAPSTEAVLERLERRRALIPENLRPPSRGVPAEVKARRWACRWRRRWGFRHGAIRAREDIPLEELRDKALVFKAFLQGCAQRCVRM